MSYNAEYRTKLIEPSRFVSAYSHKTKQFIEFPENSEYTRQEFKDECDINNIMAQYQTNGGEFFHINESAPQYMDCPAQGFREQMDFIAGAYSMFEQLPSNVRARFENDPAEFLDFCSHEKNRPELGEMGLLSQSAMDAMVQAQQPPKAAPAAPLEPTAPSPAPSA